MELKIDKEFYALLPMSTPQELQNLEDSILEEGVCEAVTAMPDGSIVDGMSRFIICRNNNLAPPPHVVKDFASRHDAILWILRNQLGRRNLIDAQRIELAERFSQEKSNIDASKCLPSSRKFALPPSIIKETATISGVSERTINTYRAVKAAAAASPAKSPVRIISTMMKAGAISISGAKKKIDAQKLKPKSESTLPDSTLIDEALSALARFKGGLVAIVGNEDASQTGDVCGFHLQDRRQQWLKWVDETRHAIRMGRPYSVCPYCQGKDKKCSACKGIGWVGKSSHHACPKELLAKIKDTIRE